MEYAAHPIAEVFPLIEGDDFETFADDIAAKGQREPIVIFQNKILDGRNRERACKARGIEPKYTEFSEDDPVGYVVSKNLARRFMNESQRAMAATKVADLFSQYPVPEAPKSEESPCFSPEGQICPPPNRKPKSTRGAAKALNVSERSVKHARKVRTQAVPEVQNAVDSGKLSVSTAAKVSELPADKQREVAKVAVNGTKKETVEKVRELSSPKKKSGKPLFDDRPIKDTIGKLVRLFDDRAKAHGKSAEHQDCLDKMELVLAAWNRWQKNTAS